MDREVQKIAVEVTENRIRPLDVFGFLFEKYEDRVQSYSDSQDFDKFQKHDLWRIIGADELDEGFWIWKGHKKTIENFVHAYTMQGNWRKATDDEIEKMKSNNLWLNREDIEENSELEPVLCIDSGLVEDITSQSEPFIRIDQDRLTDLETSFQFRKRGHIEEDPSYKQLIPYTLIRMGDDHYFSMQRKTAQSESRLHNKKSLGVGGHIPEFTWTKPNESIIESGMYRELHEEVYLPMYWDIEGPVGLIYDDSNDVGRVHIAVVYIVDVDSAVKVKETDKMDGGFRTIEQILKERHMYENWSQILIDRVMLN